MAEFKQYQLEVPKFEDVFETLGNNTLVRNGSLQSPNYVPSKQGYTLNNDGTAEFQDIIAVGNITANSISATTGDIGGFTIGTTSLTGTNLVLDSSDQRITLGSGNDIIILDANDATYRLWAGHATAGSAPFYVTKAGAVVATNVTITSGNSLIQESVVVYAPLKRTFIAGEAISDEDAVSISDGTIYTTKVVDVDGASDILTFGKGTDSTSEGQRIAQSFSLASSTSIKAFNVSLRRNSGSFNLVFSIQADSAGSPSGTDIGSLTVAAGDFGTVMFNSGEYAFSTAIPVTASTTYWFVMRVSSDASSATDYMEVNSDDGGNPYANGKAMIRSYGGTWANAFGNTTSDIYLELFEEISAGTVFQSSAAANNARCKNFVGFADSAAAKGASVDVHIQGEITLSGLSVGTLYYLSDTAGEITNDTGTTTVDRKVGIATASDALLITNNW